MTNVSQRKSREERGSLHCRKALLPLALVLLASGGLCADVVNLRDYLSEKGYAPTSCVIVDNESPSTLPATNLFDGVTVTSDTTKRWLGAKDIGTITNGWFVFKIPDAIYADEAIADIRLASYRLWKLDTSNATLYGKGRTPTQWEIFGSNNNTNWVRIGAETVTSSSWDGTSSQTFDFRPNARYRYVKFVPCAVCGTPNKIIWVAGLLELELFVQIESAGTDLVSYLETKGVTASACASGGDDADGYGSGKLFDGIRESTATDARWMGGKTDVKAATVTFEIPTGALPENVPGVELTRYRLWRTQCGNEYDISRAPRTWKLETSLDGTNWELCDNSFVISDWESSDATSVTRDIPPDRRRLARFFRFTPLSSTVMGYLWFTWKASLQELQMFVDVPDPQAVPVSVSVDNGAESVTFSPASDDGTYPLGTQVTITAQSETSGSTFRYWENVPAGAVTNGNQIVLTVGAAPVRLHARYARRWEYVAAASPLSKSYPTAGITDGNWKLLVREVPSPDSDGSAFAVWRALEGSGVLDFSTLAADISATSPHAVRSIDTDDVSTFEGRSDLTGVVAPGLVSFGTDVFRSCVNLRSVEMPDLRTVAQSAFEDCTGLKSITPTRLAALTEIQSRAFRHTDLSEAFLSLPSVTNVNFFTKETPSSPQRNFAFAGSLLGRIDFTGSRFGAVPEGMFLDSCQTEIVFPKGVTNIATIALGRGLYDSNASVQELRFGGLPPVVRENWAYCPYGYHPSYSDYDGRSWQMAFGVPSRRKAAWMADAAFVPLAEIQGVASKPNYAAMRAKYGDNLLGVWNDMWVFEYRRQSGLAVILR